MRLTFSYHLPLDQLMASTLPRRRGHLLKKLAKSAMQWQGQVAREEAGIPVHEAIPERLPCGEFRVNLNIETDPDLKDLADYLDRLSLDDPRARAAAVRLLLDRHMARLGGEGGSPVQVSAPTAPPSVPREHRASAAPVVEIGNSLDLMKEF